MRHTEKTCFEIHGYLEWYWERKKQLKAKGKHKGQTKLAEHGTRKAAVVANQARHNLMLGKLLLQRVMMGPGQQLVLTVWKQEWATVLKMLHNLPQLRRRINKWYL